MNYKASEIISRLIRGIVGLVIVIEGIMNSSWIGLLGVLFLMTAITGRCGFGSSSCEVKSTSYKWDKDEK